MKLERDETLLQFATARQAECLTAYWDNDCSTLKAGAQLGINNRAVYGAIQAVQKKAARQGYSPAHDMARQVPDGFHLKGTSTLYGKDGKPKLQWVKSSIDHERQREIMLAALEAAADALPRLAPRTETPTDTNDRLMACYPIGDLHVGMRSWPEETGEDWNLQIAERIQCGAMARLVELSPACETATIVNLGDWFHADNTAGVTERSGHHLDTDGRYGKMFRVGVKIMRQCIESALSKHGTVRVINVGGNHDDTGTLAMRVCLANIYENEPRVIIDEAPGAFHYFRHGRVLVGTHHGHSCKPERLPGVMAADRPKDWGDTDHRYWWMGHVHHQSLKDYPGVTVESFRTLAAKDAYASWGGYRAPRDMKCIVLDLDDGEVHRITMNAAMVERELCRG